VQGSPLSPLFANIYLHEFDTAMTQAGFRLVRYADDFLILCPNESRARHALEQAQQQLAKLQLSLNPKKTRIVRLADGTTFLGYVFDADGCYQPAPDPRAQVIRASVQHALQRGTSQAVHTGRAVAQAGKGVAARLTASLKPRGDRQKGGGKEGERET
jgi:hypothetical protein